MLVSGGAWLRRARWSLLWPWRRVPQSAGDILTRPEVTRPAARVTVVVGGAVLLVSALMMLATLPVRRWEESHFIVHDTGVEANVGHSWHSQRWLDSGSGRSTVDRQLMARFADPFSVGSSRPPGAEWRRVTRVSASRWELVLPSALPPVVRQVAWLAAPLLLWVGSVLVALTAVRPVRALPPVAALTLPAVVAATAVSGMALGLLWSLGESTNPTPPMKAIVVGLELVAATFAFTAFVGWVRAAGALSRTTKGRGRRVGNAVGQIGLALLHIGVALLVLLRATRFVVAA